MAQDLSPENISKMKQELQSTKATLEHHKLTIKNLEEEKNALNRKRDDLEDRLTTLEADYEELLDKTIAMEEQDVTQTRDIANTIRELKTKLEGQFLIKREMQEKEIATLKLDMEKKKKEENELQEEINKLQAIHDNLIKQKLQPSAQSKEIVEQKEKELERMRKSMAQELADFETMKKVLMRDLQSRCEKVVELEITLDETRIQQTNLLKATNNRAQQKKMALLERNLEQLTNVQKQVSILLNAIHACILMFFIAC
ncbi:hypothetical protein BDB01DRAFT_310936 [Pilobolus umbonatus]|nr:hypothetical protein BDB01DRAFT_310936 [Pilobolus umbonatus]